MSSVDNNLNNQRFGDDFSVNDISGELEELNIVYGGMVNIVVGSVIDECIRTKRCSPEKLGQLNAVAGWQESFPTKPFKSDLSKASAESLAELACTLNEASLQAPEIFEEINKELSKDGSCKLRAADGETLVKILTAFDKSKTVSPELLATIKNELLAEKSKKLQGLSSQSLTELLRLISESKPCDTQFVKALQNVVMQNCGRMLWQATVANLGAMSNCFTKASVKDRELAACIHQVMMSKYKS